MLKQNIISDTRHVEVYIYKILRALAVIMAILLITYASFITFQDHSMVANRYYENLQFAVCCTFLCYFISEEILTDSKINTLLRNLPFLLLSLPYLFIFHRLHIRIEFSDLVYLMHFFPLVAASILISQVITRIAHFKLSSTIVTYLSIIIMTVYIASLIFFQREGAINPQVHGYGSALWWSSLQATTVGSPIDPLTPIGKIMAFLLSSMGMMMFPLFTVYASALIKKITERNPDSGINS